jgi:AraC family transcriptional regulator
MNPRIEISQEKKLIGKRLTLSFSDYNVVELWRSFMPRRKEIKNNLTDDLISMAVYKPEFFKEFNPSNKFEKWATMEVADFGDKPDDMEIFILESGLYAVFDYKGSSNDHRIYDYILRTWLPKSNYILDDRPHFEVLGDKFKTNDPTSEEEIWIPIRHKI